MRRAEEFTDGAQHWGLGRPQRALPNAGRSQLALSQTRQRTGRPAGALGWLASECAAATARRGCLDGLKYALPLALAEPPAIQVVTLAHLSSALRSKLPEQAQGAPHQPP